MTFLIEFHGLRGVRLIVQNNLLVIGLGFVTLVGMAHTMAEHNQFVERRLIDRINAEIIGKGEQV